MSERVAIIDANPRRARKRKGNRRVQVQRRTPLVWFVETFGAIGRAVWPVLVPLIKLTAFATLLAATVVGGRYGYRHVVASPRFALASIEISPTSRVTRDEVVTLAAVAPGDRLLELEPKAIAAAIADHPWVAKVNVERQLPATLRIQIVEREALAVAALDGLYLLDAEGHPFKRATMAEAEGLPVITGLDRQLFLERGPAAEAAYREALALLAEYRRASRPSLSEIAIDARTGFTLFFLEGGAEVRLGRGDFGRKLAHLDRILEALNGKGGGTSGTPAALKVIHLDGASRDRVAVRTAGPSAS